MATSTWLVENFLTEEEFELLRLTFCIQNGVPTCIVEVKEDINERTDEEAVEVKREEEGMEIKRKEEAVEVKREEEAVEVTREEQVEEAQRQPPAPAPTRPGVPLRRSTRRRTPRVCPYCL